MVSTYNLPSLLIYYIALCSVPLTLVCAPATVSHNDEVDPMELSVQLAERLYDALPTCSWTLPNIFFLISSK